VDVNTQDEDWGKPWLVTVGSGYSSHHFLVFGSSEDSALAHAIETAVVTAPGWTARPGDEHLEEMLREYDGEGYATDDGSVYLGHFDSLHIRRLDNNVRSLLQRHGVSLEGEGSSNRGSRAVTDKGLKRIIDDRKARQMVMIRLAEKLREHGFTFHLEHLDNLASEDSRIVIESVKRPTSKTVLIIVDGKLLGRFPVSSVSAMVAAMRGGARGSRSTGPTDAELRAVGRYTKSVNPDEKKYAREAGHGTGDLAIGKYVYSHYDDDSFAELLDHVREQGLVKGGKGSRAKRAETFSVGDKVKHKREFLRSIGWMTNVPRNGVVRSVTDGFSGRQLLEVAWSDGTTSKIISPNVTHAGKVELV